MSRTRRGNKPPGWEHWGNIRDKDQEWLDASIRDWEEIEMNTIPKEWKVTPTEYLMGRDKQYPLSPEQERNMLLLLEKINDIRDVYGKPLVISSGYRPGLYNKAAGGEFKSCHLTCEAIDIADVDRKFTAWCLANQPVLVKLGLYMEDPGKATTWVHLQTRAPKSGKRVFLP